MSEPVSTSFRVRAGDGREFGPAEQSTLELWVRESRVTPATLVWASSDNAWREARERGELDTAFASLRDTTAPPVVGPPLNSLSVWSFVLSQLGLCCCVPAAPAILCGFVSLHQIRARGERGRGLAVSGIILGFCGLALGALTALLCVMGASLDPETLQQILNDYLKQLEQAPRS